MFTLKIMFFFSKTRGKLLSFLANLHDSSTCKHCNYDISKAYLLKNWYICIYLYTFLYKAIDMLYRHNNNIQLSTYSQVPLTVNGCLQAQVLHKPFWHGLLPCSVLFLSDHLSLLMRFSLLGQGWRWGGMWNLYCSLLVQLSIF